MNFNGVFRFPEFVRNLLVPLYTTGTIHLKEYEEIPLAPPPPPPGPPPTMGPGAPRVVRSRPRLTYQAHISGTVILDALVDERGNVVQAHAVSGPALLIPAAIKAVLQWKYEPTSLDGQPVSLKDRARRVG